jgi:oxygen-dependent protoporphyrinogen oxidase
MVRVVVVGGGIAGLAAAHRLRELGEEHGIALDVVLWEAGPHLGGTIATIREQGYLVEVGPDSFLTERPWAIRLCERLGVHHRLVPLADGARRIFVAHRGALHPLPPGFQLLAPSRLLPVLTSSLFSWRGKARMALDLVLPRSRGASDESLEAFVTRRLGREVLERVAQPLVAGIYTADPATLSAAATMPRFLEMERRFRSLILATRRMAPDGARGRSARGPGPFASLDDGMETLVRALAARLPPGTVRCGRRAVAVAPLGTGASPEPVPFRYRVLGDDGTSVEAHGVVVATPSHEASRLLAPLDRELARLLEGIPYASSAVVTLAYPREGIGHPLDGSGFVVPRTEGCRILACTFSSVKFPGRAPAGRVLLRAFLGGALDPDAVDQDDATLTRWAEADVGRLLRIASPPLWVRVDRHRAAMPQYVVGHRDRVAAIEARVARHPGLALAGSAYRGVGIPECIRSGEEAAARVLGLEAEAS